MVDPKTTRIDVRLLPAYRTGLELLAERRGVKLSAIIRDMLQQGLQAALDTNEIRLNELTPHQQSQPQET